jgi:methyl-accepting chemotaxis protein
MIGIVYQNSDHIVIAIVDEVQSISETDIIGKDASVKGIDLTQASFCVVNEIALQVGDTLGAFVDVRKQIPATTEQKYSQLKETAQTIDERTQAMQDVDQFTLQSLFIADDRTQGMQEVDQFTLDWVTQLQALVDAQAATIQQLQADVQTLKGGA